MAGYAAGWLTFESGMERRRLIPAPQGWEQASIAQLREWLMDAIPGRPARWRPNRREHPRVDVRLSSAYRIADAAGVTGSFTTTLLNLSAGGAKIRVPEKLPVDQELELVMHLPHGGVHTCRARVVRSSGGSGDNGEGGPWVSLRFVEVPAPTRAAIEALILAASLARSSAASDDPAESAGELI